jgi:hypothetical protein
VSLSLSIGCWCRDRTNRRSPFDFAQGRFFTSACASGRDDKFVEGRATKRRTEPVLASSPMETLTMDYDQKKVDATVLALLTLTMFKDGACGRGKDMTGRR